MGKTQVALLAAEELGAEIVSCDSMQVYRGMDIATAKPTSSQCQKIPHHMINIVDIHQEYDVSKYVEQASLIIDDIVKRSKKVLVVGGTGMYVRALTDGLFEGAGEDKKIRTELEAEAEECGLEKLFEELQRIDCIAAEKINPNDKRRIIRALEVYKLTGKPISSFQKQWGEAKKNSIIIGLNRDRDDLYARIDKRVDGMFDEGLIDETKRLMECGIEKNKTAVQALGYKEVIGYIKGDYDIEEAKRILKQNTRRYAKRQLTWFRKDDRVKWFVIGKDESVEITAKKIINFLKDSN